MGFDTRRVWGPKPRYPRVLAHRDSVLGSDMAVIAGPCSVESPTQIGRIAREVAKTTGKGRLTFLRGGIYKAGTYPPEPGEFGIKWERVRWLSAAANAYGLLSIAEVLDVRLVRSLAPYVDAFQVGARHCQDYALLEELARTKKIVTLKRNMGMTLDEFLGAAEYLARGTCKPMLIERGGASQMNHVRWDLSLSLIPAIKRMTAIPIIVDASHGTGRRDLVEPMTLAGMAAGADGFLVECHPEPKKSWTDTDQAFPLDRLGDLVDRAETIHYLTDDWGTH